MDDHTERHDWQLFRTLETLAQKAGTAPNRLRRLVLKELVDNALDAAGDCEMGRLGDGGWYVEDRGDGISGGPQVVARMFSINRPLVSSKLVRLPTRGALGNGLRVVAGAVLASGGRLAVTTRDKLHRLTPRVDGTTAMEIEDVEFPVGTRVEIWMGDGIPDDPGAHRWAADAIHFARVSGATGYKGATSAYWYDSDSFAELCLASSRTVRDLMQTFDGLAGAKVALVSGSFTKGRTASSLTRQEADTLLAAARGNSRLVRPSRLGAVGDMDIAGYAKESGAFLVVPGQGGEKAVIPFVVEAWAVPSDDRDSLKVFVNRTPITAEMYVERDPKRKSELGIYGCELAHGVNVGASKVALTLNVETPHIPLTGDGKSPDLYRIAGAIVSGLGKAARKVRRRSATEAPTQREYYFSNMARGVAHASGNGKYRFSQRQLLYSLRQGFKAEFGKEPLWKTFTSIVTAFEAEEGEIRGMYFDERGSLYHPHTGETISLGTLAVENYKRPAWTFHRILYVEKGGFLNLLRETKWAERNDCALLTSQGYASRAARDVIDMLGETEEPLTFYCVHDADAYGTSIYEALQSATAARPERRVQVVNLGLEPAEALEMGLEPEPVEAVDRTKPCGSYVSPRWRDWLQRNRVELNAMSSPEFIEWIDRKISAHGKDKLVPPQAVLAEHLAATVEEKVLLAIRERVFRDQDVDGQTRTALAHLTPTVRAAAVTLKAKVKDALEQKPEDYWTRPVEQVADEVVRTGSQS